MIQNMIHKLKRWIILLLLVVLPFAFAIRIFSQSEREKTLEQRNICRSIYINIEQNAASRQVHPWRDESGAYYLVLPAYAQEAALSFGSSAQYDRKILLDGKPVEQISIISAPQRETSYLMTVQNAQGRTLEGSRLTVLFSDNLPTVYVTTKTGSMDTVHASKDNREKGTLAVYTQDGALDYEGQLNYIKGRGNITWQGSKKPYNLSLEQEESLLAMDGSAEWVLLTGAYDPSYIRNRLAFELAKQMGLADTSDSAFVELYLNGEYAGLYLLTEKVWEEEPQSFGESASAQEYLLELEMQERLEAEPSAFRTAAGQGIVIKSQAGEEELQNIAAHMQKFEDAVYAQDWLQVKELTDMDSFTKIYLVEEILQNQDAYISSQYLRLFEENGSYSPLYSGPVWDFDNCLTPKDGMFAKTLTAAQPRAKYPKYWIPYFMNNAAFQNQIREQYGQIRSAYLEEQIWRDFDELERQLQEAVVRDCLRWRYRNVNSWRKELHEMKTYLAERLAFLDRLWIDGEQFCTVHVEADSDTFTDMDYLVKAGEVCGDYPAHFTKQGYEFEGWYLKGTDTAFDTSQPIYGDVSIEARWTRESMSAIEALRQSGLLQARYLLSALLLLAVGGLLLRDRRRGRG